VVREPTRQFRGGAVVLVLAAALLLAACSGGGSGSSSASASSGSGAATSTKSITISNFMFSPMHAAVAPGSTVSVTNKDSVTHTLTAAGGQFNTGDIGPGQTKTFTAPTKAGTYDYICNIHQYMMGTIVVR
jgi:plastocyanin